MTEEDAKKLMGEDAQVTEFQNNVEEITFWVRNIMRHNIHLRTMMFRIMV